MALSFLAFTKDEAAELHQLTHSFLEMVEQLELKLNDEENLSVAKTNEHLEEMDKRFETLKKKFKEFSLHQPQPD